MTLCCHIVIESQSSVHQPMLVDHPCLSKQPPSYFFSYLFLPLLSFSPISLLYKTLRTVPLCHLRPHPFCFVLNSIGQVSASFPPVGKSPSSPFYWCLVTLPSHLRYYLLRCLCVPLFLPPSSIFPLLLSIHVGICPCFFARYPFSYSFLIGLQCLFSL